MVFWDIQSVLSFDSLSKVETINSGRYQETLKKFHSSKTSQSAGHYSATRQSHTAEATTAAIAANRWPVLSQTAYSCDLPPSDFHLFGPLKDYLRRQKFEDDESVKGAVNLLIRRCSPLFFSDGLNN